MIGDIINIKEEYFRTASDLLSEIKDTEEFEMGKRMVFLIGGESGSGKSVTAICLAQKISEMTDSQPCILHLDDYFKLPPTNNHNKRLEDINWVGKNEVRLDLLQTHLDAFSAGALHIAKPLVNYNENCIGEETVDWNGVRFLLIEGTYSFFLKNADFKIFMKRNYHDTRQQRLARGREADDPFIENVLEIEHRIIAPLSEKANAIVNKDYTISIIKK